MFYPFDDSFDIKQMTEEQKRTICKHYPSLVDEHGRRWIMLDDDGAMLLLDPSYTYVEGAPISKDPWLGLLPKE